VTLYYNNCGPQVVDKERIQQQNMGQQIKKEVAIMKLIRHRCVCVGGRLEMMPIDRSDPRLTETHLCVLLHDLNWIAPVAPVLAHPVLSLCLSHHFMNQLRRPVAGGAGVQDQDLHRAGAGDGRGAL
jgi:hypothetical protein